MKNYCFNNPTGGSGSWKAVPTTSMSYGILVRTLIGKHSFLPCFLFLTCFLKVYIKNWAENREISNTYSFLPVSLACCLYICAITNELVLVCHKRKAKVYIPAYSCVLLVLINALGLVPFPGIEPALVTRDPGW